MSTPFQVGDTVRVLPTECDPHNNLHANVLVTIEHADETHVRVSGSPLEWFARRFELVKRADAAPSLPTQDGDDDGREAAPLDPKSVHVGDTVTVRFKVTGDVITTKAYQPDDITAPGECVYLLGWPLHRANGTFGLAFSHFEILAVEPAPEPEPEWKVGALADITNGDGSWVRAIRVETQTDDEHVWQTVPASSWWSDANVTDVRPLVVIDPAAVDVDHLVDIGSNTDDPRTNTLAILAGLGLDGAS